MPTASPPRPRRGQPALMLILTLVLAVVAGPGRAADLARAEEIVQGKCFICHGVDGESSSPLFPRLAGQHATYIARQLADYHAGRRVSSAMQPMVAELSAPDFEALGRYFETRTPQPHMVADPELAAMGRYIYLRGNPYSGVPACAGCHGTQGHGSASLPRLAGQHSQYTENQLKQFHQRQRNNDNAVMHSVAVKLTELEIKAVASYLSGLP